jgi:hypothetical protein
MIKKIFFALVMLAIGCAFLGVGSMTAYKYLASANWVDADATIVDVGWKTGKVGSATTSTRRVSKGYQATVQYTYRYNGRSYQSNRVNLRDKLSRQEDAQRAIYENFKTLKANGKSMPVSVNPKSPTQSVIYRDIRWGIVATQSLIGTFALLFGLAVLKESFD